MKYLDFYVEPTHAEANPFEGGRRTCFIKQSKSKASTTSSTATTTNNTDKRQVVDNGVGVSSDSSTVTVNVLDEGIVKAALDTVRSADAVSGEGFSQLLGLADKLFTGAGEVVAKSQDAALSTVNDSRGAIDQKTIVVLALAGAAAFVLSKKL